MSFFKILKFCGLIKGKSPRSRKKRNKTQKLGWRVFRGHVQSAWKPAPASGGAAVAAGPFYVGERTVSQLTTVRRRQIGNVGERQERRGASSGWHGEQSAGKPVCSQLLVWAGLLRLRLEARLKLLTSALKGNSNSV